MWHGVAVGRPGGTNTTRGIGFARMGWVWLAGGWFPRRADSGDGAGICELGGDGSLPTRARIRRLASQNLTRRRGGLPCPPPVLCPCEWFGVGPCRSCVPAKEKEARALSLSDAGSRESGLCEIPRPPDRFPSEAVPLANLSLGPSIPKARLPLPKAGQPVGVVTLDFAWTLWKDHPTFLRPRRRRPALPCWRVPPVPQVRPSLPSTGVVCGWSCAWIAARETFTARTPWPWSS